jgi:hypothetical protein
MKHKQRNKGKQISGYREALSVLRLRSKSLPFSYSTIKEVKMGEYNKKYRWPASALTGIEMAFLTDWRRKTGTPITKLLKRAVQICQQQIEKGGHYATRND